MARKVFYSFHYSADNWRAAKIRNMGVIEGNPPASDNAWEQITQGGENTIARWIDSQMQGRSCAIVLVGAQTAGRKWIDYEIKKAWESGKGLLGIHIHNLLDRNNMQSRKGANPFAGFNLNGTSLATIVPCYDPPGSHSQLVYGYIAKNLERWIEEAIILRGQY